MPISNNIVIAYRKAYEKDCIELITHAFLRAVKLYTYRLDWLENDFSELLCTYINESHLSLEKGITCTTEYRIHQELFVPSKGYADKLPRIDFVYHKIFKLQRYVCYMEAKRLKQNDNKLARAYIIEGMGRFITKKYPIGCMLGYLIEGNLNETVSSINNLLTNDSRGTETLHHVDNIICNFYYESHHQNIGTLKHLIFDFVNVNHPPSNDTSL